jgi:cytochrome c oxidase subunit 2
MTPQSLFHHDFAIEVPIAIAVFALITGGVLYAVIFRRRRPGREPSSKTSYTKVEMVYTGVVAAAALFLVVNSLTSNGRLMNRRPAVTVNVTAFQWCWRFQYQGTNVAVSGQCLSDSDMPTFVVPAGQVIQFNLTSADVIHAFWIPYLRYKVYAFPNHVNTFQASFSRQGTYAGRCAEFCGLYHHRMDFTAKVTTPGQFQTWLRSQSGGGAGVR